MTTDSVIKQPIKRLELPISKFNDVAIPHHLELLKRHEDNINKFKALQNWDQVYKEQVNAARIVKQLKQLLYDMDILRVQVLDSDIFIFDELTTKSRTSTIQAIKEYLELEFQLPLVQPEPDDKQDDFEQDPTNDKYTQLYMEQNELERQKACLHAWNSLQNDLQQLHQLYIDFNKVVMDQREHVERIENNVETAEINVKEGNKFLEKAVRYKMVTYPVAGALIGACMGGPVGLLAGIKLGGLTAVGGGILGFTSGQMLKNKHLKNETKVEEEKENEDKVDEKTSPYLESKNY